MGSIPPRRMQPLLHRALGRPFEPVFDEHARSADPSFSRCALPWSSQHSVRELIEPKGDKRYIRRDNRGHFTDDQVSKGNSDAANRRSKSTTEAPKGEGDKGKTTR